MGANPTPRQIAEATQRQQPRYSDGTILKFDLMLSPFYPASRVCSSWPGSSGSSIGIVECAVVSSQVASGGVQPRPIDGAFPPEDSFLGLPSQPGSMRLLPARSIARTWGMKIRLVAPAGPVRPDVLESGLASIRRRLPALADSVSSLSIEPDGPTERYFSAPDAVRAEAFIDALTDPDTDLVWCARGGYGCARILEAVEQALTAIPAPNRRPVLLGFSDITALHWLLHRHGYPAWHGPVVTQCARLDPASWNQLEAALLGKAPFGPTLPESATVLNPGAAEGPLLGGNLAVLSSLAGTPWSPKLAGAVVFLEDIAEPAYRVDRMIQQLVDAADLRDAAALLLGDFTNGSAREQRWTDELFRDLSSELGVPVLQHWPCGHETSNWVHPMGVRVALDTGAGRFEAAPPATPRWLVDRAVG